MSLKQNKSYAAPSTMVQSECVFQNSHVRKLISSAILWKVGDEAYR